MEKFEEYALTHPTEQKYELPTMIRIGTYKSATVEMPALLPFEEMNGLCFETNQQTRNQALRQMQYIALSLLKQVKPELLSITFVDIGLDNNFSMLNSLKEHNIKFVTKGDSLLSEIERLYKTAHDISTNYLCGEYVNLQEYNDNNSDYKAPYNILFIANFPKKFSEEEINAINMLIDDGGIKCGIQVIMNLDKAFYPEKDNANQKRIAKLDALVTQMVHLDCTNLPKAKCNFNSKAIYDFFAKSNFEFETYPQDKIDELRKDLMQKFREQDNQPQNFLTIPIGRKGRDEICFEMGERADVYHGMLAGVTRTGKSTLLNNIITSIADRYSPDEMRLYLLDYKGGVEFQIYENHPNVELLLLDNSKLDIGVESLKLFKKEIDDRMKLFRQPSIKASTINEYNKKAPDRLPRMLMIIDEVQQLFTSGYQIKKEVNDLFKYIVKQGGAFGVHLLFSSQTFYDCGIADDALSNMRLRISYRLASGTDCRAIMKDGENDEPLRLQKYHLVYNTEYGRADGNIIVKADNFEKDNIIPLLEQAAEKHKGYKPFERKIYDGMEEIAEIEQNDNNKNKYGKEYFGF